MRSATSAVFRLASSRDTGSLSFATTRSVERFQIGLSGSGRQPLLLRIDRFAQNLDMAFVSEQTNALVLYTQLPAHFGWQQYSALRIHLRVRSQVLRIECDALGLGRQSPVLVK